MDYNAIFRKIASKDISGAYLFHGEEEYIKQNAVEAVKSLIDDSVRDMNVTELRGPLFAAVRDACETLPFFAEKRLVIAYEMQDAEIKLLFPYVNEIPVSSVLIVYVRGKASTHVTRLFSEIGRDASFNMMDESEAVRLLEKRARERNITIDYSTAALLVEMVGVGAHTLLNEFAKAADYVMDGGRITADVLKTCVTPQIEYESFRMLDQLVAGKKAEALVAMRHLINGDSSSAIVMSHFFTRQLKNMLMARLLLDQGVKESEIGKRMGVKPWPARTAIAGAKRVSSDKLKQALLAFATADYMQVSGRMPSERVIELAVMRYF